MVDKKVKGLERGQEVVNGLVSQRIGKNAERQHKYMLFVYRSLLDFEVYEYETLKEAAQAGVKSDTGHEKLILMYKGEQVPFDKLGNDMWMYRDKDAEIVLTKAEEGKVKTKAYLSKSVGQKRSHKH